MKHKKKLGRGKGVKEVNKEVEGGWLELIDGRNY